jgi:methylase of polypeptide subunit release factors
MPNVSEEISQMSADLLLKALGAFGQLGISSAKLAFEIGKDQRDALIKIAEENEMQASILNDFSGNPRVAVLRKAK